jgi:alkanesulfonate monooxygenase SsuD/methylene tetrahydromethanopterin reductase-like flavin-dependent oxidoreductase (luciferase family)
VSSVSGSAPLALGSVSLRLYPCPGTPAAQLAELRAEAALASEIGYDGVQVSEHHAGFPGYLPNPVQLAGFLLAAMPRGWVAPCPLLLPLKARALVVEELAWLAAAYPGRVGAGFAAGALPVDFELAEVPFAEVVDRFKAALPWTVAALRGEVDGPLGADLAVAACAAAPIPMVVAAQSEAAVRRAAALGVGVLYDSLQHAAVGARLSTAYRDAGGTGPVVLIRRVWIGQAPTAAIDRQMAHYRSYAPDRAVANWGAGDGTILAATPEAAAADLLAETAAQGADTVNVRVQVAGLDPPDVRAQLQLHGAGFVAALKAALNP